MIFADSDQGQHVTATSGARGYCPGCAGEVLAKCGAIVAWHWAHVANNGADCDSWSEAVGAWHLAWQALAPTSCREVTMRPHRADLRSPDGFVIELQASSLSVTDIAAREDFYGREMLWIFDAREALTDDRLTIRPRDGYVTFRWKHPRKSLTACNRRVLLDIGGGQLLDVRKIHTEAPCGGWGRIIPAAAISAWLQSWWEVAA